MHADSVFNGPVVSLKQVLDSRSAYAERQQHLLSEGAQCLISFGLNIPGNIKCFPLAFRSFYEGLSVVHRLFQDIIVHEEIMELPIGNKALIIVDAKAHDIKRKCICIEETHHLGRIFDFDVIDSEVGALSREILNMPPRKCFLCGNNAKICGRSQTHSIEELRFAIGQQMIVFFRDQSADLCQKSALKAMLHEVSATPKPGLVDRRNSGSHKDMDFGTFIDSSSEISVWIKKFYCIGWDASNESSKAIFDRLRFAGQQAEQDMFSVTSGINTQKGLIFSLALICGAMGVKHFFFDDKVSLKEVMELSGAIGRCALDDFNETNNLTNGKQCFKSFGVSGIRGEAAAGFPSVWKIGFPIITAGIKEGKTLNDSAIVALLALMAEVDDTNMIHRGGYERSVLCKKESESQLKQIAKSGTFDGVYKMDDEYISKGLSPGGCADLLALSLFLYFADQQKQTLSDSMKYEQ